MVRKYRVSEIKEWLSVADLFADLTATPLNPIPTGLEEGNRNNALFDYARMLRIRGLNDDEVKALGLVKAEACTPPLGRQEALQCIESSKNYKNIDTNEIARLVALSPVDYDRIRIASAKAQGIRTSTLDDLVIAARCEIEPKDNTPFADIEPWPEPINPAVVLDEISGIIGEFIVLEKYQADIAALWIAATWFIDGIDTAPIALINAPEKSCGKTQLLTLFCKLALRATQLSGISPSVLFRIIEKYQPTLCIDEIETVLKDNEELRGLLNAGHTRDSAYVWRIDTATDDFEPKRHGVYGMKAIAGINAIKLSETITSRSIVFKLRRKKKSEKVERLRYAEPELFNTLAAKLARFSADYSNDVKQIRPNLPEELGDREQDNIEPLLQIAHVAGSHWPDTATKAASKIYKTSQKIQSVGNELLGDIQEIFKAKHVSKIRTVLLIEALVSDEEKRWATYNRGKPLTPKQLASKLEDYSILPKTIRLGHETFKGYELNQFTEVFDRYLSDYPLSPVTPSQSSIDADLDVTDRENVTVTED